METRWRRDGDARETRGRCEEDAREMRDGYQLVVFSQIIIDCIRSCATGKERRSLQHALVV